MSKTLLKIAAAALLVCITFYACRAQEFYERVNKYRAGYGLPALKINRSLERQASRWLKQTSSFPRLVHNKTFRHFDAEVLAENGDPFTLWINSIPHRSILLNRKATAIGVAFYNNRACARLNY